MLEIEDKIRQLNTTNKEVYLLLKMKSNQLF